MISDGGRRLMSEMNRGKDFYARMHRVARDLDSGAAVSVEEREGLLAWLRRYEK